MVVIYIGGVGGDGDGDGGCGGGGGGRWLSGCWLGWVGGWVDAHVVVSPL